MTDHSKIKCLGEEIWERHVTSHDLRTAQGRAYLDRDLVRAMNEIPESDIREHVAEKLRNLRRTRLAALDYPDHQQRLNDRLSAIETYLGLPRHNIDRSNKL